MTKEDLAKRCNDLTDILYDLSKKVFNEPDDMIPFHNIEEKEIKMITYKGLEKELETRTLNVKALYRILKKMNKEDNITLP